MFRLIFGFAVAAALLVQGFAPARAAAAPAVLDRLEASVNSSMILYSDVQKFRRTMKQRPQMDPLFAGTPLAEKGESAPASQIVDFLIDERLIADQFPVSDAEVEQAINEIQANNHLDRQTLRTAVVEQGFPSFEDYYELIRTSVSKKDLIDRDIRSKVTITDDDVKNYFYNNYAHKTSAPMAYTLKMITIPLKNYKTPGAAKDAAVSALKDLHGGEDFAEVAKTFGDDSTTASGGDLGTMTEDQMSGPIRDAVRKLKIGETSEILGGPAAGAYSIMKLVDVKSSESERFVKMKEEIRNQLVAAEWQHQIQLWLDRQRQAAFIHRAGEPATQGLPLAPAE